MGLAFGPRRSWLEQPVACLSVKSDIEQTSPERVLDWDKEGFHVHSISAIR